MEAEQVILGCILKDNSILKEIALTEEHFSDYSNKRLYSTMLDLERDNQPIDAVTIMEKMGVAEFNRNVGNSFLSGLMDSVPSIHAFKSYESIIIKNWKASTTRALLQEYMTKGVQVEQIQQMITELNEIDQAGIKESFDKRNILVDMFELPYKEVPKGLSGIPSGFKDLDGMTDGFQKQDSIIIGARPSMGKTAFILNIATNAGKKCAIPIIFSLEMGKEALIKRMLSAVGRVDGIKTRNPFNYFNEQDKERWRYAIGELEKMDFHIFDKSGQTVAEMRAKTRQIQRDNPDKDILVLIDYLTLIQATSDYNGNTHARVSEISADLKAMAKELNIPVITLAQLSRGVEQRQDKHPMMSDLRESGSIEQDADVIAFLYRDDYYNDESESKNILEVDIAKQRNGPTGMIELAYMKEYNLVTDLDRRRT